jgi:hypothetical protein
MKMVVLLLLLLFVTTLVVRGGELLVRFQNVPYDADMTVLCEDVYTIYHDQTVGDYNCSHAVKEIDHMELLSVYFPNFTTNSTILLNTYPEQLNLVLTNHSFFDLFPGGVVTVVSPLLSYIVEMNWLLGALTILYSILFSGLLLCTCWRSSSSSSS